MGVYGGVIAQKQNSTGLVTSDNVILLGIHVVGSGSAGNVQLVNGTTGSGDTQLDVETPGANRPIPVFIPSGGIRFTKGVYLSVFSNLQSVTLFFEKF